MIFVWAFRLNTVGIEIQFQRSEQCDSLTRVVMEVMAERRNQRWQMDLMNDIDGLDIHEN